MRLILIFAGIAILGVVSPAAEITTTLDRCVVLNSQDDNTAESRFAFSFTLLNEIADREIIYSEIYLPLTIQNVEYGDQYEFILFPLTSNWSENDIDYQNSETITDSISAGAYTVILESTSTFHLDITTFISELNAGDRTNYGLIGSADLLGDRNIRLPQEIGQAMISNAEVRIIYK